MGIKFGRLASFSENKNIGGKLEFDLVMPRIWHLHVHLPIPLMIKGSGLLQLPSIELKLAAVNEGIIFSGMFGLHVSHRQENL